jgi:hypothetical protein
MHTDSSNRSLNARHFFQWMELRVSSPLSGRPVALMDQEKYAIIHEKDENMSYAAIAVRIGKSRATVHSFYRR